MSQVKIDYGRVFYSPYEVISHVMGLGTLDDCFEYTRYVIPASQIEKYCRRFDELQFLYSRYLSRDLEVSGFIKELAEFVDYKRYCVTGGQFYRLDYIYRLNRTAEKICKYENKLDYVGCISTMIDLLMRKDYDPLCCTYGMSCEKCPMSALSGICTGENSCSELLVLLLKSSIPYAVVLTDIY